MKRARIEQNISMSGMSGSVNIMIEGTKKEFITSPKINRTPTS